MIIEGLFNLIYKMFELFICQFNVPPAPDEFLNSVDSFFGYLESASNLISFVLPVKLAPFFSVTVVIMVVEHGYPFLMWVLRKIPFLGIE